MAFKQPKMPLSYSRNPRLRSWIRAEPRRPPRGGRILLGRFLEGLYRRAVELASDIPDPEHRLREMAEAHVWACLRQPQNARIFLSSHPVLSQMLEEQMEHYLGYFRNVLKELKAAGRMRPLDPESSTANLLMMLSPLEERHPGWAETAVEMALNAVLVDRPGETRLPPDEKDLEISRRYLEIENLIAAGADEAEIDRATKDLRYLQEQEAARMEALARRRRELAPGAGYAALEQARSLLGK